MLLTLTDHLTCPRCGPQTGLILFMERAEERRVVSGALGCPVCRTQYRIDGRVADLRVPAPTAGESVEVRQPRVGVGVGDVALRVAALLELGEGKGFVLVDGPLALEVAGELGGYLPDYELVVPIGAGQAEAAGGMAVSAFLGSEMLPMTDRTMRAVAFVGGVPGAERLRELVRACRPTGRLVIQAGSGSAAPAEGSAGLDDVAAWLEETGARVRARDATGLVAVIL